MKSLIEKNDKPVVRKAKFTWDERPISRKEFMAAVDGPTMTRRVEKLIRWSAKHHEMPRNELLIEALEYFEALHPVVHPKEEAGKE